MRRECRVIAICLVVGVLVTISLIWLPQRLDDVGRGSYPVADALGVWEREAPASFPAQPNEVVPCTVSGGHEMLFLAAPAGADAGPGILHVGQFVRAGWPWRAATGVAWHESFNAGTDMLGASRVPGWTGRFNPTLRTLQVWPTRLIWSGFVGNALVFAFAAYWARVIWTVIARRTAEMQLADRDASGRCPACGYDLRGSTERGCSECGWERAADNVAPS